MNRTKPDIFNLNARRALALKFLALGMRDAATAQLAGYARRQTVTELRRNPTFAALLEAKRQEMWRPKFDAILGRIERDLSASGPRSWAALTRLIKLLKISKKVGASWFDDLTAELWRAPTRER